MALGGLKPRRTAGDEPRAVLFDAMGTLVWLAAPGPALVEGLRANHGLRVAPEQAERAARMEMAYYRAHHDEGADPESLAALRLRCAQVLREALPAAAEIDPADLLSTLMGALTFQAFSDAVPTLRTLRDSGWRLAVVSNWDSSLPEVLGRVGLADHVDAVLASAVVGASKPSPAIFAAALSALDVAADRAVHVGDTVEHDVAGARAAGVQPVLLRRELAQATRRQRDAAAPDGVPVIASLAELASLGA